MSLTLRIALQAAVPLHIAELQALPWPEVQRLAAEAAYLVASHGDALEHRERNTPRAFNALARGLAALAFAPGGVDFGTDLDVDHFEARHPENVQAELSLGARSSRDSSPPGPGGRPLSRAARRQQERQARATRAAIQAFWARLDRATAVHGPFACATCTDPACCEDAVVVGAVEADVIAAYVREHVPGFEAAIDRWRHAGGERWWHQIQAAVGGPGLGTVAAAFRSARIGCPFLERGRCVIYAVRPLACRGYVSLAESPTACRAHADRSDSPSPPWLSPLATIGATGPMPDNPGRELLPLAIERRLNAWGEEAARV